MKLAVIKIRSSIGVRDEIRRTFKHLNIQRVNHCTIIDDTPSYRGMLQKAKDYITWGPVDLEVLKKLVKKRGRIAGNRPVTDDVIKERTGYSSVDEFVENWYSGNTDIFRGMKKTFRLHPPSKGHRGSIKKPFRIGGTLGDRGEKINELLEKMI